MDNKKFLEWLTALTYWEYPRTDEKPITTHSASATRASVKRKLAKKIEAMQAQEELDASIEIDEDEELLEEPIFKDGINPTRHPVVIGIRHEEKMCEDCGMIGKDRRIEQKLYQTGKPHWRKSCTQCSKVFNPDTKKFDLDVRVAHFYFKDKITRRNK